MELSILCNVSKLTFKVDHRYQDIHAQSILHQLRSLSRQITSLSFATPFPKPCSDLVLPEDFVISGKATHCIYKPAGMLQRVGAMQFP